MSSAALITIVGMAVVTYTTRASGLWLANRMKVGPRLETVLAGLPGVILVSLVAPAIVAAGLPGIVATVCTVVMALWRRGNIVLPMLVGVVIVWALRTFM
jgi:branched chain amino acid efflux pump